MLQLARRRWLMTNSALFCQRTELIDVFCSRHVRYVDIEDFELRHLHREGDNGRKRSFLGWLSQLVQKNGE